MSTERELHKDDQGRFVIGDLVLSPASENDSRTAMLPTPTEDARSKLGKIELTVVNRQDEERDYLPDPAVSWIVDATIDGDPLLDPNAVSIQFSQEWREKFGSFTAYGRDVDSGRWTFLLSADGPKTVDRLKFEFDYIDHLDDETPVAEPPIYEQRLKEIERRLESFGVPKVMISVSPVEAHKRSHLLKSLKRDLDATAILILKAPPGQRFSGKKIWDVMLCLGLRWGDMDCFHWDNESGQGDDYFFSVETSTAPGYFLPEVIAADKLHTEDLVFVFSIPRCAKPVEVFDSMYRAAEYAKARLGGTILNGSSEPADFTKIRQQIAYIVDELKKAGFEPGAGATLRLF